MTRLEDPPIDAGKAAGDGEENISAVEILLEYTHKEEANDPDRTVAENRSAGQQPAVERKEAFFPKSKDEERETSGPLARPKRKLGSALLLPRP